MEVGSAVERVGVVGWVARLARPPLAQLARGWLIAGSFDAGLVPAAPFVEAVELARVDVGDQVRDPVELGPLERDLVLALEREQAGQLRAVGGLEAGLAAGQPDLEGLGPPAELAEGLVGREPADAATAPPRTGGTPCGRRHQLGEPLVHLGAPASVIS